MHAVVFAYHDVGVNCLKALIGAGIQIDLVLTHQDDPNENVWFGSVAKLCEDQQIPYLTPTVSELTGLIPRIRKLAPDYLFSLYYRHMIPAELLACAKIAALNMHGSLLPKYRGRAPVNWAILHGETQTGATLHIMEVKPDAGDIVGQSAVTIGPDETATDVFGKVSKAELFWRAQTGGWAHSLGTNCQTGPRPCARRSTPVSRRIYRESGSEDDCGALHSKRALSRQSRSRGTGHPSG